MKTYFRSILALALFLAVLLQGQQTTPALAACDMTITSSADSGAGALRDALASVPAGGTVCLNVDVNLTSAQLTITKTLTIEGNNHIVQKISGSFRIFAIQGTGSDTVTMQNLTIKNGVGGGVGGGGIRNFFNSNISLHNVIVSNNGAAASGAAILMPNGGILSISNSSFSANSSGTGGAISSAADSLTIASSTFNSNTASTGGGAIHIANSSTTYQDVTIKNNTFYNNQAPSGGAIYSVGTSTGVNNLYIYNSTFSNNQTGISVDAKTITKIYNTIVANSTGVDCSNAGSLTLTAVLIEDGTCGATLTGNPSLGALQNNGGNTMTMAIPNTSIAYNAGNNATCLFLDQRGVVRPQNGTCDLGAYEQTAAAPVATNTPVVTATTPISVTNTPTLTPPAATNTPTKTPIPVTNTPTNTPPIATNTPAHTPLPGSTSTPTATSTSPAPTDTATATAIFTDTPTVTPTPLPGSTDTPTATVTNIPQVTDTPTPTDTPTATATPRVFPTRLPPNGCMPSSDSRNRANNPLPVCPPLARPVFIDSGQALGQGDTEAAEIANLTQDSFPDVLVSNDGRPELLINNGSGGFFVDDPIPSLPDPDPSSGFGSSLELADIDADGDVDVVTARPEGNQVWLNDGTGNFSMSNQTIGSGNSSAIALGDIDQDNDMDVVIGTPDNQPATIWLNDGTGKFSDSGQVLNSGDTQAISLGDIDNDNDLDIITVGNITDTIWLQDGTGKFSASDQVLNSGNSQAISLGDLDNDNDLDIITVGNITDTVWLQDGTGIFTDTGQVLNSGNSQAISLGDLDMDGDYDAVTVNGETGGAWLNDGTGIFTNQGQTIGNGDTQAISLGDLDMDGDLDIYEGTGSDNPRDRQRQTSQPMPDHIWQNLSPQLKMIGAEGVKIKDVAKQYTTHVTVLSNSLTTTVQFVYTPLVTPTHAYSQLIFAGEGRAFNLSAWQNGQAIANPFIAPISVTMQYDAKLASPKLYAWQAQTGQWVEATTGCSPASAYQWSNDTVTMSVCQLTDFALFTPFPKVYLPIVVKTK